MNPNISPLAWFRQKADAKRLRVALEKAGISSLILQPGNPPDGWQAREQEGFDLWVDEVVLKTAGEVYQKSLDERATSRLDHRAQKPSVSDGGARNIVNSTLARLPSLPAGKRSKAKRGAAA